MTLEEARKILRDKGLSTCLCKFKNIEEIIQKAEKIKEEEYRTKNEKNDE